MISADCHMTRAVYFLFAPWEDDDNCIKAQKQRLVKYVNIKIWQSFLVHIIFKVSSINIWIHIYSVFLSVVIEWVNMLKGRWDNSELRFTI